MLYSGRRLCYNGLEKEGALMKKIIAILCAAALAGLAFTACGAANRPERLLAGQWVGSLGPLEFQAMEFVPSAEDPLRGQVNLTLIGSFIHGNYEIIPAESRGEPARLRITYTLGVLSTSRDFHFIVDQETLVLQMEGSAISLTYTRSSG